MQTAIKNTQKDQIKEILQTYQTWSAFSKSNNHQAMLNIIIPNSGFSEITNICRKSWEIGIDSFYEFNSLKVIKITNNPSYVIVQGEISLIISKHRFISTGVFRSSCVLESVDSESGLWKLAEIEIEWEF
ncbi:MAG: hypothetical protein K8R58_02685 [Bacteroidales bacterium]|nr:hypothetical protein [Bacteroidales bacterium]